MLLKKTSTTQTQGEIKKFYESPVIEMSSDPLLWWKNNKQTYPILYKLSIDHIAMMPTSTSSERCFSVSNRTITKLRSSLKPDTVKKLMTIYSWNRFEGIN